MRFRARPRPLNLLPRKLDSRLRGYAQALEAANAPAVLGFRDTATRLQPRVQWFTVVSEDLNHLEATVRGSTLQMRVMKPPDLQGHIAARTFAGDDHQITPAYSVGVKIYGLSVPNGTHVGYAANSQIRPYEFIDLNIDARQWARVPT